jgi:hypothetical protein
VAKQEFFMRSIVQATQAYELSVDVTTSAFGHNLKLISFVPSARNPADHVKFQGLFSSVELKAFRDALNVALLEAPLNSREPTGPI